MRACYTHVYRYTKKDAHKTITAGEGRHPQLCVVMAGQTLYNKTACMYSVIFFLAALGLTCGMQDLQLQHANS